MNRIAIATLVTSVAGFAAIASAQQPAAPPAAAAPPQRDFSKTVIKPTDLGNNTYMLEGEGGNITVAVGKDAVVMVDSEFAPLHDRIKAAIENITKLPVTRSAAHEAWPRARQRHGWQSQPRVCITTTTTTTWTAGNTQPALPSGRS